MNLEPEELILIACAILGAFIGAICAVISFIYFEF